MQRAGLDAEGHLVDGARAPNALLKVFVSRIAITGNQASTTPRAEKHYDHERHAEQERPARPQGADGLGQPDKDEGADDRPVERARAADQGGEDDVARGDEADGFQRHDAEEHRVEPTPARAGEGAADHEGGELETRRVVAHGLGAQLVLADRLEVLAQGDSTMRFMIQSETRNSADTKT